MSCVARGASDTTFYILAVYFGSVGITKTRNAVTCGLIADFFRYHRRYHHQLYILLFKKKLEIV